MEVSANTIHNKHSIFDLESITFYLGTAFVNYTEHVHGSPIIYRD